MNGRSSKQSAAIAAPGKKETRVKSRFSRIVSALLWLVFICLAVSVGRLIVGQVTHRVTFFFGNAVVQIQTGSMKPEIEPGQHILVRRTDAKDINVGNIITFYSEDPAISGMPNTHRVVGITEDRGQIAFVTKGDNNPICDAYLVHADELAGRYVRSIPALTSLVNFLRSGFAFFFIIAIPILLIVMYCVTDIVKKRKEATIEALVREEVERLKQAGIPPKDIKMTEEKADHVQENENQGTHQKTD